MNDDDNPTWGQYTAKVLLTVQIEAPDLSDAKEMLEDHYGVGSGGEGLEVVSVKHTIK